MNTGLKIVRVAFYVLVDTSLMILLENVNLAILSIILTAQEELILY